MGQLARAVVNLETVSENLQIQCNTGQKSERIFDRSNAMRGILLDFIESSDRGLLAA
jgi:hypothetical protein